MRAPVPTVETEPERIERLFDLALAAEGNIRLLLQIDRNIYCDNQFFYFAIRAMKRNTTAELALVLDERGRGLKLLTVSKRLKLSADQQKDLSWLTDYAARVKNIRDRALSHLDPAYKSNQVWHESGLVWNDSLRAARLIQIFCNLTLEQLFRRAAKVAFAIDENDASDVMTKAVDCGWVTYVAESEVT